MKIMFFEYTDVVFIDRYMIQKITVIKSIKF